MMTADAPTRSRFATWDVWWADLSPVRGSEQAGHRPVLIISSDFHLRLMGQRLVTVHPLTTTDRNWDQHVPVATPTGASFVMTEQFRSISADRLTGTSRFFRLTASEIAAVQPFSQMMLY